MDLSVATVGSSAETDVGAEHKAQSVPSTAHHNSTVGQQSSAPVRFKIRTAQERALLKQAGSQQGQNELHKLSILREGKSVNAKGEECQMKQAENPTVKGADEVSVVSATDVNDTLTGIKPNSRSNKLETQNQDKLTEIPKPVNGKTKPDSRTSQLQSDSRGSSSHTGYSENWAVYRGRPQWRRVNAPSRSKSLDWREESRTDAGKLQVQNFLESHVGRRAESLERGGRNVNAGPEIQPLRSNSSLSVKKGNSCQSLPSRLKSNQGGASEDRYFGSGTTEPSNSARTAGGVFANQSILNRIEKLYGSSNSDAGLNNNEAKKNCDGARDCEIDNRQHLWHSDTWRKSVHDVQWRSMTHKGQNGGTFPRRSSEGNNFKISENAKNPSGPVSLAKPLLSSADDTVGVLNPSGSQCEPSRVLSQQSSGSSNNPQRHGDAAPVDKDGSIGSFDVCTARSGSEAEDLEDEDDDDDNSTEKGNDSNYDSDSGESSVTITSNMSQCDHRSFSATLADLCNFGGVEYASRDDLDEDSEDCASHRTASLSSDISAFSSVSLLATEELDRLISDVRNLGDESLQSYEDVQVVVLHKEVGCGLGFTVAGGMDQNKAITVHKVFPGGLAAQEGSIQEGDEVLSINGTALQNCAHWEALRTLRRARARGMAVVVLQKGTVKQLQKAQVKLPICFSSTGRILRVMLNKSSTDLGFSLEGGLDSSVGDRSITVKKVFHGGPVSEVSSGDELLEIAGHNLHGLRRLEVWSLIKKLPPGPVEVLINLHQHPCT
uniref:Si:dkey-92i15.4 n=1 Tax=Scleropages formosus TaxID=113540 RepID=A0A8C9SA78_SCLFO